MEVNLSIAAGAASVMPIIIICDILIIIAWKILGARITSLSGGGKHLSGSVELEEKAGGTKNGGYPLLILLIVIVDAAILFSASNQPKEEGSASVTPTVMPSPTRAPAKTEEGGSRPAPTPYAVKVLEANTLAASGQKAVSCLTQRVKEGCPLSVYDPKGTEEEEQDFLYDNALAALALLSQKNPADTQVQAILDEICSQTDLSSCSLEGMAYAAITLLQYDKLHTSVKYVKTAQDILDQILENRKSEESGFFSSDHSNVRSTAENLLLYSACQMVFERTGIEEYAAAARNAEKFVQSMRSSDGTYYLAGADSENPDWGKVLSTKVQALAGLILNDQTGLKKAESLWGSKGGYLPDDGAVSDDQVSSRENISSESTLLMDLAYQKLGLEEKERQGASVVYSYQIENGGIPETNVSSFLDSFGKSYKNVPRTAAAAWYILAVKGINPFVYGVA